MEFPHLGKHCSEPTCNRLDFLPVNCDSCEKTFCSTHYNYDQHKCPNAGRKDKQVPVCPLCGEPVPTAPGVEPDLTVGQHIDQQCKSDTRKIFTNRCNYKTCKRKELIPVTCSQCHINFCLRHRHFADHECKGSSSNTASTAQQQKSEYFSIFRKANSNQEKQRSLAGNAAERRRTTTPPNTLFNSRSGTSAVGRQRVAANHLQTVQGDMTEDEALARALALSIMELDENADRNRRDEVQSRTTAQTPVQVGGRENSSKDKCSLS